MDAYRNGAELAALSSIGVSGDQFVRIENGRGLRLRVESGRIWITQERSNHDVVLKEGESCTIEQSGVTLISTFRVPFALVSVEPCLPLHRAVLERLARIWAGLYTAGTEPGLRPRPQPAASTMRKSRSTASPKALSASA